MAAFYISELEILYPQLFITLLGFILLCNSVNAQTSLSIADVFTVAPLDTLPAPAQLAPLQGNVVSVPVHFTFEQVLGSWRYYVEVSPDSSFQQVVARAIGRDEGDIAEAWVDDLNDHTTYYWRVSGENEVGIGKWSEAGSFKTALLSNVVYSQSLPNGSMYWADYDGQRYYEALFVSRDSVYTALYGVSTNFSLQDTPEDVGLPQIRGTAVWMDVDLDQDPDLILAGEDASGEVITRLYTVEDGVFTLESQILQSARESVAWGRLGIDPGFHLLLSDVDKNGEGISYVIKQTPTGWTTLHTIDLGGRAQWIDFDGDSDDDIIIAAGLNSSESGVRLYRNDLDSLVLSDELPSLKASAISIADYNQDGSPDVVLNGHSLGEPATILLHIQDGKFVEQALPFINSDVPGSWIDVDQDGDHDWFQPPDKTRDSSPFVYLNQAESWEVVGIESLAGQVIHHHSWIDVDEDEDLDLVISGENESGPVYQVVNKVAPDPETDVMLPFNMRAVVTTRNSATLEWDVQDDPFRSEESLRFNLHLWNQSAVEQVMPLPYNTLANHRPPFLPGFTNIGAGRQITLRGLEPDATYGVSLRAVDINGQMSRTSSGFSFKTSLYSPILTIAGSSNVTPIGDIDSDGDVDGMQTVESDQGGYIVNILNQENGRFVPGASMLGTTEPRRVAVADYDRDNDLDVLIAGRISEDLFLFTNKDGFNFEEQVTLFPEAPRAESMFWEDWDVDGDYDLVMEGIELLYLFRAEGSLLTGVEEIQDIMIDVVDYFPGDADNDGDLDILALGPHDTVLLENNDGVFTPVESGIPNDYFNMAAWGDYDNDGDLDISIGGYTPNPTRVFLYENRGGSFVSQGFIDVGRSELELGWADFDNDGNLDLVAGEAIYFQEEGEYTRKETYIPLFYKDLAFQDIDGDHDVDLIYRNVNNDFRAAVIRNQVTSTNEPPSPPTILEAKTVEEGTGVRLRWSGATDDTTPGEALSYNLRIGEASRATNVLSPSSIIEGPKEGYRLIHGLGNAGKRNEYILFGLDPVKTYYWSVQAQDNSYAGGPFSEEQSFIPSQLPSIVYDEASSFTFDLKQNTPNPFNPSTTLAYSVPRLVDVRLSIYDLLGRRVTVLVNQKVNAGNHTVTWDATSFSSGVYVAHIQAGDFSKMVKMVLVK